MTCRANDTMSMPYSYGILVMPFLLEYISFLLAAPAGMQVNFLVLFRIYSQVRLYEVSATEPTVVHNGSHRFVLMVISVVNYACLIPGIIIDM